MMLSGLRSAAATASRTFRSAPSQKWPVRTLLPHRHGLPCISRAQKRTHSLVPALAVPPNRCTPNLCRNHSPTFYFSVRCFSTPVEEDNSDPLPDFKSVRIHYGTSQGTAQLFAIQLADELAEAFPSVEDVTVAALDEAPPDEVIVADEEVVNIIITSVTGVGDPPPNAKEFYEWLHSDEVGESGTDWAKVRYTVFGLGNYQAHPNHYNVIGKYIDKRIGEFGAQRVHELGLGDDSGCIEDDYDTWVRNILSKLKLSGQELATDAEESLSNTQESQHEQRVGDKDSSKEHELLPCAGAIDESGTRRISRKYPKLKLHHDEDARHDMPREDLFFLNDTPTPFYQPGTTAMPMVANRALRSTGGEYIMHEMRISLEDVSYESGDHLSIYPKNAQCIVDAYLAVVDAHGSSIIEGIDDLVESDGKQRIYPHPFGVTVEETLMYCVDLGAPPSPSFARKLLGRKEINYKEEVAEPRRTVIELIRESGVSMPLEELLFNLSPMQARYYSIASSPLAHPKEVYLTYRPVKYVTSRGSLRDGVCTSYMKNLHPVMESRDDDVTSPRVAASVRSNPTFRLPDDDSKRIILIAGGCGIAPIRSFVEERMCRAESSQVRGKTHLFLGFRSPGDEVYRSFIDRAVEKGVITEAHISYTKGCVSPEQTCQIVSETVKENSKFVVDALDGGAYVYLCGGARQFGAAIEQVLLESIAEHKSLSDDGAAEYLRTLLKEGRLAEDLAD